MYFTVINRIGVVEKDIIVYKLLSTLTTVMTLASRKSSTSTEDLVTLLRHRKEKAKKAFCQRQQDDDPVHVVLLDGNLALRQVLGRDGVALPHQHDSKWKKSLTKHSVFVRPCSSYLSNRRLLKSVKI